MTTDTILTAADYKLYFEKGISYCRLTKGQTSYKLNNNYYLSSPVGG